MRNGTLDHARLIAAVGIVVFHSGAPGAWVGYAALPFFLMLLIVLAWPAAERQSLPAFARGRAARLMIPWLIWSCIYGTL
jgi:peptidoglycan/LPS O-acetylase OafA/YrhL